jgi:hypothetical protein
VLPKRRPAMRPVQTAEHIAVAFAGRAAGRAAASPSKTSCGLVHRASPVVAGQRASSASAPWCIGGRSTTMAWTSAGAGCRRAVFHDQHHAAVPAGTPRRSSGGDTPGPSAV